MDKKLIIILIFFLICFTNSQQVRASQEELVEEQIKDLQVDTLIQDIEKVTDKNINLNENNNVDVYVIPVDESIKYDVHIINNISIVSILLLFYFIEFLLLLRFFLIHRLYYNLY